MPSGCASGVSKRAKQSPPENPAVIPEHSAVTAAIRSPLQKFPKTPQRIRNTFRLQRGNNMAPCLRPCLGSGTHSGPTALPWQNKMDSGTKRIRPYNLIQLHFNSIQQPPFTRPTCSRLHIQSPVGVCTSIRKEKQPYSTASRRME